MVVRGLARPSKTPSCHRETFLSDVNHFDTRVGREYEHVRSFLVVSQNRLHCIQYNTSPTALDHRSVTSA